VSSLSVSKNAGGDGIKMVPGFLVGYQPIFRKQDQIMKTQWILLVSGVAFGSVVMLPFVHMQDGASPQVSIETQHRPSMGDDSLVSAVVNTPIQASARNRKNMSQSFSDEVVNAQSSDDDSIQSDAVEIADAKQAFPDTSTLAFYEKADPVTTDEAALEADRKYLAEYYPAENDPVPQVSESKIEYQRLQMEQQIAEEAYALENQSPASESDFVMPPLETN
jgi:hypothetical protein